MFQVARNLSVTLVLLCAAAWSNPPPAAPAQVSSPPIPGQPFVPPGAATAAAPPAATNNPVPTPVDPAGAGLARDATQLGDLRRQTAAASEKLKLLTAEAQVRDAEKHLGQNTTATADIPELIGIEGTKGHMRAQFLVGTAITSVAAGQMLTAEWKIEQVMSNGVSLSKRGGGRELHTILFGHAPVRGGTNLLTNEGPALSNPMMPPMQPMQPIQPMPVLPGTMPAGMTH